MKLANVFGSRVEKRLNTRKWYSPKPWRGSLQTALASLTPWSPSYPSSPSHPSWWLEMTPWSSSYPSWWLEMRRKLLFINIIDILICIAWVVYRTTHDLTHDLWSRQTYINSTERWCYCISYDIRTTIRRYPRQRSLRIPIIRNANELNK